MFSMKATLSYQKGLGFMKVNACNFIYNSFKYKLSVFDVALL